MMARERERERERARERERRARERERENELIIPHAIRCRRLAFQALTFVNLQRPQVNLFGAGFGLHEPNARG